MIITFIDAGVLIAAARGRTEVSAEALAILDDPDRSFASSEFVRLEVLPKALFNRKSAEAEFYLEFFHAGYLLAGEHRCCRAACLRDRREVRNGSARRAACRRSHKRRRRRVCHNRKTRKASASHDGYPCAFNSSRFGAMIRRVFKRLARAGKIAPIPTHRRPLNQAQAALDDLRSGRIVGRTMLAA